MAQIHLHIPSFNAGELSPLLGARFAVEKVQAGCRRLRNFIPHVHGPVFRRPGMEYIAPSGGNGAKSSLRGFNFSTTTGFILEFHPDGLQVYSNGAKVPLKGPVPLPYSEAACAELQIAEVNDVCYIVHPDHAPRKLVRYADDDWRLQMVAWKWPALTDENVRSDDQTTPVVTTLLSVGTAVWDEFNSASTFTFSVVSPDISGQQKVAKLQTLSGGEWLTLKVFSWTFTAPSSYTDGAPTPLRMTYDGPIANPGSRLQFIDNAGTRTLPLDVFQPNNRQSVTVPVGKWQATVECPAVIPHDAVLKVQRKTAAGAWVDVQTMNLLPSRVTVYRGDPLTRDTEHRFLWTGRAMTGGVAKIESLVYPPVTGVTLQVNALTGANRTMTASDAIFTPGHVGSFWQLSHRRNAGSVEIIGGVPTIDAGVSGAVRVTGKWSVYTYGIWEADLFLEKRVGGDWEIVRSWTSRKDRNIIAEGDEEEEIDMRLRIGDGTSVAASGAAAPRFLLETANGRVYGIVEVTAIGALNADGKASTATVNILEPLFRTTSTSVWSEGAWSGARGFPRSIALHGQRLWFGGTRVEPIRLWGSVVNDYENFRQSSIDDAAVSFVPSAQQSNAVQWMISQGENLVFGTNGDEWTIAGGTDSGPITPTSVLVQRRSGYGSRFLPAILLGEMVIFVQRGGRKLRSCAPRQQGLAWQATDTTVLAEHIAREGVVQTAAMFFPQTILWAVTASGKLLGMTFEQEQNVFAWHVHETDGLVESVAVVFGVGSDEVWLGVNRGGKRSVERLDSSVFALSFGGELPLIYLDAARRYDFATPTAVLDGLHHLEGREVSVLGDGAELPAARVVSGAVTLGKPVSKAVVGLPFLSELQPMRMDIPLRDGTAQHRGWKMVRVGLYLHESLGGEVADALDGRFEKLSYRRTDSPMDTPLPLFSGEMEMNVEAKTRAGADVIVRTSGPLPLNVGSLTLKGDVFGE